MITSYQRNSSAIANRAERTERIAPNRGAQYLNFQQLSTSTAYREQNVNILTPELFDETASSENSLVPQEIFSSLTDSFHLGDSISLDVWSDFACTFQSLESSPPTAKQNDEQPGSCETRLPHDSMNQALNNIALPQETRLDYPKSRGKFLECYKQAQILGKNERYSTISPSEAFAKDPVLSKQLEEQKAKERSKSSMKRKRGDNNDKESLQVESCLLDDTEAVVVLHDRDVLAGRGGAANNHPGNLVYWTKVLEVRAVYKAAGPRDSTTKTLIAKEVFDFVHKIGGRFLERAKTRALFVQSDDRALEKIKQACRDSYVPQQLQTRQQRRRQQAIKRNKKRNNGLT
eukprot:Nitzschia sp. Nitz4//scaffold204_size40132//28779//29816//NITZ4_007546-RA/size40132-processed-gene-0.18-mRNA-1//1//CDS//3329541485//2666//frame0